MCLPPTCYGEYPWCALFRKILNSSIDCLLCMALLCILGILYGFLNYFFLLSVCSVHRVLYVLCMYICIVLLCGYVVNTVCMLCGLM